MSKQQRVVIGLGTGRCGTHSLTDLLAAQPDTVAFHQPKPCLPWHADPGWYRLVAEHIADQDEPVVALVGWYYLPYLDLLARDFDARFVCLQRDRAATVASIDRLTPEFDHWSNRSPLASATTQYRLLFPQYDVDDKLEGIGLYWDEYYRRAAEAAERRPDRVALFVTDDLNTDDGVSAILDAAGYGDERVLSAGIRSGLMTEYRWKGAGA